jgi:hypothetical protein
MNATTRKRRPRIKGICCAAAALGVHRDYLRRVVNGQITSPKLLRRYHEWKSKMTTQSSTIPANSPYSLAFQQQLLKGLGECQALMDITTARLRKMNVVVQQYDAALRAVARDFDVPAPAGNPAEQNGNAASATPVPTGNPAEQDEGGAADF